MKRKVILCSICIVMVCLFSMGCGGNRLGDFTVLSSKNVNLSNFSNSEAEQTSEKAIGEDCKPIICIFSTGIPNMKAAVDKALETHNAYMLTNARLDYKFFYIPLIYGESKYVVSGTPVKK